MATMYERAGHVRAAAAAVPMLRKQAAESADDATLADVAGLFPLWESGAAYKVGTIVRHYDKLYRIAQNHTAQAHQPPNGAGMLAIYTPVQPPAADGQILDWISGETLSVGDKRRDPTDGKVYQTIQNPNANVWEPHIVPAIWEAISE
ncbi:hypothetical protein FACS18948_6630 [Clostridia bacterium]|nr:hypothetical protein FACS18948_6630 [Clostridia bacterium]